MDSELQDALDWYDGVEIGSESELTVIVEAARKVANPDYRAHVRQNKALNVSDADAKAIVDAVLSVTEDADAEG